MLVLLARNLHDQNYNIRDEDSSMTVGVQQPAPNDFPMLQGLNCEEGILNSAWRALKTFDSFPNSKTQSSTCQELDLYFNVGELNRLGKSSTPSEIFWAAVLCLRSSLQPKFSLAEANQLRICPGKGCGCMARLGNHCGLVANKHWNTLKKQLWQLG